MGIKDILIYIDNDDACANRLGTAISLCSAYDARLTGLYTERQVIIPTYSDFYMPSELLEEANREVAQMRDRAETLFSGQIGSSDTDGELLLADSALHNALDTASCYADLLLIPKRAVGQDDLNPHYEPSVALVSSACPVLMLNSSGLPKLPPQKVLLAWNGERECARAVSGMLSLFPEINTVDIVTVSPGEGSGTGHQNQDIGQHIARHGIKVNAHHFPEDNVNIGQILLSKAEELGSDMLVMGAYGHSRLREFVLGGVTRFVLNNAQLPVLFAH